ncbi:MAG TPA: response regulator [Bryobacteraceae bacterium]|jgi:DNA-binding response OmpR family regulator|nr:response regulator [Bryobacteraceae bacterium]
MSRVLLVDDDVDAVTLLKMIFEHEGHQVNAASTAARAREQFHAQPPETVILDLRLPDPQDGLALIREFRAASPGVKIIVLAGWCADLEGRSESAQVDLVLSKPVRSEVLLSAIQF